MVVLAELHCLRPVRRGEAIAWREPESRQLFQTNDAALAPLVTLRRIGYTILGGYGGCPVGANAVYADKRRQRSPPADIAEKDQRGTAFPHAYPLFSGNTGEALGGAKEREGDGLFAA